MNVQIMLHQLYIMRSQVDMMIAMAEGIVLPDGGVPECQHPEEKRRVSHNMGQEPEYICLACGKTVKGVA